MVRGLAAFLAMGFIVISTLMAQAQAPFWVQIEANRSLSTSESAARGYASTFDKVVIFRLEAGWYAVAAGPYTEGAAQTELARLRRLGLVPRDAYVEDNNRYGPQVWPAGANARGGFDVTAPAAPEPEPVQIPAPAPEPAQVPEPATVVAETVEEASAEETPGVVIEIQEETRAQALRSESALSRDEKKDLQIAMQWFGFYRSGIDGDFGNGTRRGMTSWQASLGYVETGVLTTRQRVELLGLYAAELSSVGLQTVRDEEAGIEMLLPMARIAFSRYEPPFVHYNNTDGSGTRVLLISQQGTRATLFGLYDIMQTLEIVPLNGERQKNRNDFVLTGQSDTLHSYTYARFDSGQIKGFTVTWDPADAELMQKFVGLMRDSFRSTGSAVLDETLGQSETEQRIDLLSGLEIRRPVKSRSGFFIDGRGTVVTTAEAVDQCQRVTLAGGYESEVTAVDTAAGLAVLRPQTRLAPMSVAAFLDGAPRLRSEVAVAGYSFEGALGAPTLTFGTLEDVQGLRGEAGLDRLAVDVRDGDTGGPVFDTSGSVIGMLLPRTQDATQRLPDGVNFSAKASELTTALRRAGVAPRSQPGASQMAPEDLTKLAQDITVLVSCWN